MQDDRSTGPDDGRAPRFPRIGVEIACEVRQGTRPWKAPRRVGLSTGGFRIAKLLDARLEVPLRIRIPGLHLLSARICWVRQGAVGCEFAEPLHVAVFEHIVKVAG